MKRFYILSLLLLVMGLVYAQTPTTVFSDDFSTNQSTSWTTSGQIGSSAISVNRSGADWGARRNTSPAQLELTNDASGTANVNGWVFANTATTSFASPYNATLSSNSGVVTWTFNIRQIRTDPAGYASGAYGAAFILATTSQTANSVGTGYAIVYGQSGVTDPVRLTRFSGGLSTGLTNIITSNTTGLTDFGAGYISCKVTYNPADNQWELFLRNDGSSAFADPETGTLVSQGTATDNTYTGTSLGFMGAYWQGSTAATQTAFFDNFKVTVVSSVSASINVTGSLNAFSTTAGTASANQSYKISGSGLTDDISVNAPSGFELSKSSGGTYTGSLTFAQSGGNVSEQDVFVRITSSASPGSLSGNIAHTSDGANQVNQPVSGNVYKATPSHHVSNFVVSTGTPAYSVIDAAWDDATGTVIPDGYLVKGSDVGYSSISDPVDGTAEANSTLVKNVAAGVETASFTGLSEHTTYYFKVFPYTNSGTNIKYKTDGSVPSDSEITAYGPPSAPLANNATAISHEGFTARFDSVSGASSYRIDVTTGSIEELLSTGFEGSTSFPTGWTQNSSYVNNNSSEAYAGSYFAGMNLSEDYFYTPLLSSPSTISFWTRSSSPDPSFTVKVQYSSNASVWTDLATYYGTTDGLGDINISYSQKTINANLDGDYYIRWYMPIRTSRSAYFDEIIITGGAIDFVTGWNNKAINSTVVRVGGLNPSSDYQYRVRAVNDSGTSSNSNTISVSTVAEETGVGASTSISGASFTINVPALNGFTNNSVEIDPDTATTDDISMEVTVYSSSIKYSFTGNNAALNGLYWINHAGLGYIPFDVTVNDGTIIEWLSDANETFVEISDFGAKGTLEITLHEEDTLPVELSSFSAVINAYNKVNLLWVTQTETNLTGYYIYRSNNDELATATQISALINPTNTSTQQQYIYTDGSLTEDGMYYYWLQVAEMDGSSAFHGPTTVTFSGQSGPGTPDIPLLTEISNIYPNPFNPSTTISYSLAKTADVSFTIYNSRGQVVRSFNKGTQTANTYKLSWNGRDNYGSECSTGVYFIKMNAGKDSFVRKAVLMK